jgi:hypothetical protein
LDHRSGHRRKWWPQLELHVAAGLPVAGLAAFRTLRANGSVLGERVLVTGASGREDIRGPARLRSGAPVIASVGSEPHVDVVIDNVG